MLAHNMRSVARLGKEVRHTFLVDNVGRGVTWSNRNLSQYAPTGEWVWILDDDDLCIYTRLVSDLKTIVAEHTPDVIMLKMDHGFLGVLPDDEHWGRPPVFGKIGMSAFVVRRDVWQRHAAHFDQVEGADFSFISAVFASDPKIYWHNVIASQVQRISRGRPE